MITIYSQANKRTVCVLPDTEHKDSMVLTFYSGADANIPFLLICLVFIIYIICVCVHMCVHELMCVCLYLPQSVHGGQRTTCENHFCFYHVGSGYQTWWQAHYQLSHFTGPDYFWDKVCFVLWLWRDWVGATCNKVLLCTPGWIWTQYGAQPTLKLRLQVPQITDYRCMSLIFRKFLCFDFHELTSRKSSF